VQALQDAVGELNKRTSAIESNPRMREHNEVIRHCIEHEEVFKEALRVSEIIAREGEGQEVPDIDIKLQAFVLVQMGLKLARKDSTLDLPYGGKFSNLKSPKGILEISRKKKRKSSF